MKLEGTITLIMSQLKLIPLRDVKQQIQSRRVPSSTGGESVYERLKVLEGFSSLWNEQIVGQISEMKSLKDHVESLRVENQTLTQVEHQNKLEKYLNIYSARIQTLSSIIASYQRHFKTLEDQVRDLKGLPSQQHSTQKQSESHRVEAIKRMIGLKDILIKHQQSEIEYIKKAIISDKFDDLLVYVTPQEKVALKQMRKFDLQIKVITDFERQELFVRTEIDGETTNVMKTRDE